MTYTHDAAGNLATRSDAFSLTHDARQRLTQVVKSGVTSSYLQDPYGRRIRKTVGGVVTWFLWDGTQLLSEYNGSGTRTKRYAYLGDDFAPTQVADTAGVYYLHADHLQTPRLLTNSTAQIVWRARYQAYGSAVVQEDPDANGTAITLNLRFPGQYFDGETGLYQNYFRDYDPGLGRYVQADPIGLAGGVNTYAYVDNMVLSAIDPDGRARRSPDTRCINCGGPNGGVRGPYCPSCYDKSLDPKGQIPPLVPLPLPDKKSSLEPDASSRTASLCPSQ